MDDQIPGKNDQKQLTLMKSITIALEFGFIIALPLVIFGFIGKWLESRYNNRAYLAFALLAALIISTVWLYRKIFQIYKEFTQK